VLDVEAGLPGAADEEAGPRSMGAIESNKETGPWAEEATEVGDDGVTRPEDATEIEDEPRLEPDGLHGLLGLHAVADT
jgi:hypothetical protein